MAFPVAVALASTSASAEDPKPQAEDKIVCKRNETFMTGSRLSRSKKVCMKASEWKQAKEEKDRSMRRVQDGRASSDQPGTLGGGPG